MLDSNINQSPSHPPQKEKNSMAAASLIVGIFAIISCCIPPFQFFLGVVGLLLAIFSKKGKPFEGVAVAGLVLSICAILFSIFVVAYIYIVGVLVRTDPAFAEMYNEMYNIMMEQYQNFFQSAPVQ
ncbi:DUF4190 domain-containing protein [Clostridium sp. MCC353]|uniref:DUF4190 domain-containing protein n=1 Tax=Clostridium sp. MCC353 TaxID=2592646 RepID=UPI001C021824|nr:DUF4190 domain-containing protein [Clostridium sp. MCC353]MBT9776272.1 DUF4190 domain-containing protein [Clostridium sp. MCC353]